MITTINEFKKYLLILEEEEITTNMTSTDILGDEQKKQKLDSYNSILKNYNSKKNAFINILKKDPKDWEKEALKIYQIEINKSDNKKYNNKFLVIEWEIAKLKKQVEDLKINLETKQSTPLDVNATPEQQETAKTEITNITENIKQLEVIIKDKQVELKAEIQEDLKEIQKLK